MLIGIGWMSVAGGVVGIFLPLVPTVPFLLLAAFCFSRSSRRFHSWLVEHDRLGPLIGDYLDGGGMTVRAKMISIAMVWVSLTASAFMFVETVWIQILLMVLAAGITLYLLSLPTCRPVDNGDDKKTGQ